MSTKLLPDVDHDKASEGCVQEVIPDVNVALVFRLNGNRDEPRCHFDSSKGRYTSTLESLSRAIVCYNSQWEDKKSEIIELFRETDKTSDF